MNCYSKKGFKLAAVAATVSANAAIVFGDIPAPEAKVEGTDWGFVAMGIAAAFLGAIIFFWLGRKLSRRS
jgi:hypothetical protein